tara:strand:+ start:74 stop:196 length:123 start_codon:yes stop_codon:yes gene_type:complete
MEPVFNAKNEREEKIIDTREIFLDYNKIEMINLSKIYYKL